MDPAPSPPRPRRPSARARPPPPRRGSLRRSRRVRPRRGPSLRGGSRAAARASTRPRACPRRAPTSSASLGLISGDLDAGARACAGGRLVHELREQKGEAAARPAPLAVCAAAEQAVGELRRQLRRRSRRVEGDDGGVEHRARHGLAVRGPAHRRVVHADHRAARHLRAELRRLQGGGGRVADVSGTCRGRVALQHLDVRR